MKPVFSLAFGLLTGFSGSLAMAQSGHGHHGHHGQDTAVPATADATKAAKPVKATVRRVDPEKRTLTLAHEPLPHLGMPAMTMPFLLAEGVSFEGIVAGDVVDVVIERAGETFVVTGLAKKAP
jgi:Cu/Ag efflux protein CusF